MSGRPEGDHERWNQVERLFQEASKLEDESAVRAFLQVGCAGDQELLEEVRGLLEATGGADDFLRDMAHRLGLPFDGKLELVDLAGRAVGAWRLLSRIGQGGMGVVYLAKRADGAFEKQVAVKVLPRTTTLGLERKRFDREGRILARLEHPGIARMIDAGVADSGVPYFAMEFIDGMPIDRWCRERESSLEARIELFLQICDAVAYAHQNLVVHRDLKPSNILVDMTGRVRLLDFGIAKVLDEGDVHGSSELTRTGALLLTPARASPEQLKGEPVTVASDVFQLGTLLYELFVGEPPHAAEGTTPGALVAAICNDDPAVPSQAIGREGRSPAGLSAGRVRSRLEGDLDAIVMKALRKEPRHRYGTVVELADDIRSHLDGRPVTARSAARGYRLGKFVGRHRVSVAMAGILVAGTAAGFAGVVAHSNRLEMERDRARFEAERSAAVTGFLMDLFDDAGDSGARDTLSVGRLLEMGEQRLVSRTEDHPLVRIELLEALGTVYGRTGLDGSKQRVDEIRLAAAREYHGSDHLWTAQALVQHGMRLVEYHHWDRAVEVLEEGLSLLRSGPVVHDQQGHGPEPDSGLLLQDALNALSTAYREVGRVDEALATVEEYLALRDDARSGEATGDELEVDLARLAFVLRGQERYAEAAGLYEEAIVHGRASESGVSSATLNNYASLLRAMGRAEEAVPLFQEARALLWPPEGEEPADVLDMVAGNLRGALSSLGRHAEQLEVAREMRALLEATQAPGHWRVGRAVQAVGLAHRDAGDCHLAVPHLDEATAIYSGRLGPDHLWTAGARTLLASCLVELGQHGEAEQALLESYPVVMGGGGPDTVVLLLQELVRLNQILGRTEEETRYRRLLAEADTVPHQGS